MDMLNEVPLLLVDDRRENLLSLEAVLEGENCQLYSAQSGNEALRLMLKHDFALVLLDVQMPEMDGFEAATLMRMNPKTSHIPIIFVTAGMKDIRFEFKGYDVGAVDYLIKPIEPSILKSKVRVFRDLYLQRLELEMHRTHLQELVDEKSAEIKEAAQMLEKRVEERTAELLEANHQLESFTYSISHDLRAPLRHIESFSRILVEDHSDCLNDDGKLVVSRILAGCKNMNILIDSLLSLSRTSRQPLNKDSVNLDAISKEIFSQLTEQSGINNAELCVDVLPPCEADPVLIRQVMFNLIGNSLKYCGKKEKRLIRVGYEEKDGRVVYHVQDNGIGFDMKYADKLFTVFQRLHSDKDFEGTGVGLAIVHNIIQRHGGKIWAEAIPGDGATFYFTL